MGRQQLFLKLLCRHALVCLSAVLTLFFGRLWKIIFVGKSLFFYLGLGQPRTSLSSISLGRGRRRAIYQRIQSSKASQKRRQVSQAEAWWQNNSRKSFCLFIKCSATNTLAALMWRKPLNSVVLATPTHRRPEGESDGTSTQVVA